MPNYRGPDHTRNALILLATLVQAEVDLARVSTESEGIDDDDLFLPPMVRMAKKNAELGLAAQDEVGKQTRETLLAAIGLARYFAVKYADAIGSDVLDVVNETQLEFEASIPEGWDPNPTPGHEG